MSPAGRVERRAEFINFYESTYPAVAGELLALTGDVDVARTVAGASYARAWQAWPAVRNLDQPAMWVRTDAVRRTRRPPRGDGILQHGLPALPEVALDPEDEVLVAALQRLPIQQRLPLVLHYLGQIPVETIAEWSGEQDYEVDARLDSAFDALVEILDWPDEGGSTGPGDAYDWTAEALEDCARRFGETIPIPPLTLVFRRGTVKKVTRRGAPVTAAAAAAVVGLVAYLSPAPERTAQAATYAAPPPVMAEHAPAELDTATPETTASATTSPAGTTTRSVARRGTTTKTTQTATGTVVAAVPAVVVSSSPVVTTSTTPTTTTPTSTTPTTETSATSGGTGSGGQAVSDSTGAGSTDSTGSSVVTTTDSTTPDTTTATDETTDETETETEETETSTATTTGNRDDCPPTTTSTAPSSTPETETETETETEETTPLALLSETNLTTTTTATASSK